MIGRKLDHLLYAQNCAPLLRGICDIVDDGAEAMDQIGSLWDQGYPDPRKAKS